MTTYKHTCDTGKGSLACLGCATGAKSFPCMHLHRCSICNRQFVCYFGCDTTDSALEECDECISVNASASPPPISTGESESGDGTR